MTPQHHNMGTLDSAADGHYVSNAHMHTLAGVHPVQADAGFRVRTADAGIMTSTHTGHLQLGTKFPDAALAAHAFGNATMTDSLISVAKFADSRLMSMFTSTDAFVVNELDPQAMSLVALLRERSIADATRDSRGLWQIPLLPCPLPPPGFHRAPDQGQLHADGQASAVIRHDTHAEKARFLSHVFGSPPNATLLAAMTKGLISFPGITTEMFRKNQPNNPNSAKGHMRLINQGLNSTQPPRPAAQPPTTTTTTATDAEDEFHPTAEAPQREVYTRVEQVTAQQYLDATGKLPVPSHDGKLYILCIYDYDANYIRAEALKSNSAPEVRDAYARALAFFRLSGYSPRFLRLDNATSKLLETFLKTENIDFQYAPASNHRSNKAERAIQTWKNHFIAILCSTAPSFPLAYWSELIDQAEITLNLMRSSRVTPNQSAYQHVHGHPYDYNAMPLAPPGTLVTVFDSPEDRNSWDPHGKSGWYVGPAHSRYRQFRCIMSKTGAERYTDTLAWHPQEYKMPFSDPLSTVELAMTDVATAIRALVAAGSHGALGPQPHDALHAPARALQQALDGIYAAAPAAAPPATAAAAPQQPAPLALPATDNFAPRTPPAAPSDPKAPTATGPPAPEPVRHAPGAASPATPRPSPILVAVRPPPPRPSAVAAATPRPVSEGASTPPVTPVTQRVAAQPPQPTAAVPLASKEKVTTPGRTDMPPTIAAPSTRAPATRSKGPPAKPQTPAQPAAPVSVTTSTVAASAPAKTQTRKPPGKKTTPPAQKYHPPAQTVGEPPPRRKAWCSPRSKPSKSAPPPVGTAHAATNDPTTGKPMTWNARKTEPEALEALLTEELRLWEEYEALRFCDTMELPPGYKPTYFNPALSAKKGKLRVRGTAGGDRMQYDGPTTARTASMKTVKCLLNATVSEDDKIFVSADIKDFFLGTPLLTPEYMWLKRDQMTATSQAKYGFDKFAKGDRALVRIDRAIYGLPQAALLAQLRLDKHLASRGFLPDAHTACLYRHETRDITFTLVVDDFGIKAKSNMVDIEYLLSCLREKYTITVDYTGTAYLGLTLLWNYSPPAGTRRSVTFSMPGYIAKALLRFDIATPTRRVNSPGGWVRPQYGAKSQLTAPADTSPRLSPTEVQRVQQIIGVVTYYAVALDLSLLPRIGQLAAAQSKATESVRYGVEYLMQHLASYPSVSITYVASDMRLYWIADAAYLSEINGGSRFGGIAMLGDNPPAGYTGGSSDESPSFTNGVLHAMSVRSDVQVASAAEAEFGALFLGGKQSVDFRNILESLGYPQPPTWMETDNTTAWKLANGTVKHRQSKAMDMRFFWITDRVKQGQFYVYWRKGKTNRADFVTKCHPPKYHRETRVQFVQDVLD